MAQQCMCMCALKCFKEKWFIKDEGYQKSYESLRMILSRFLFTIISFEFVSAKPFDEGYGIRIAKIDLNPSDLNTRVAGGQEGSSSSGVAGLGWYTFYFSSLQKFVSIQISSYLNLTHISFFPF